MLHVTFLTLQMRQALERWSRLSRGSRRFIPRRQPGGPGRSARQRGERQRGWGDGPGRCAGGGELMDRLDGVRSGFRGPPVAPPHFCSCLAEIIDLVNNTDFGGIINETQQRGHVAQLVHIVGAAGPNRPATLLTRTFHKESFFS
jgi:hypothetical protein